MLLWSSNLEGYHRAGIIMWCHAFAMSARCCCKAAHNCLLCIDLIDIESARGGSYLPLNRVKVRKHRGCTLKTLDKVHLRACALKRCNLVSWWLCRRLLKQIAEFASNMTSDTKIGVRGMWISFLFSKTASKPDNNNKIKNQSMLQGEYSESSKLTFLPTELTCPAIILQQSRSLLVSSQHLSGKQRLARKIRQWQLVRSFNDWNQDVWCSWIASRGCRVCCELSADSWRDPVSDTNISSR